MPPSETPGHEHVEAEQTYRIRPAAMADCSAIRQSRGLTAGRGPHHDRAHRGG